MTKSPLSDRPKKDLFDLARQRGISVWDGMTKDELVEALSAKPKPKPAAKPAPAAKAPPVKSPAKLTAKPAANGTAKHPQPAAKPAANGTAKPAVNGTAKPAAKQPPPRQPLAPTPAKPAVPAKPVVPPAPAKPAVPAKPVVPPAPAKPAPVLAKPVAPAKPAPKVPPVAIPSDKDLSYRNGKATGPVRDQILLSGPDPFWLHAQWQLSVQSVQRAEAALGQDWHGAKPIIRLFDVTSQDTTSTSEAPIRDIVIHGGCSHWYIDVPQPPRSYRADIGYLSRRQTFFVLARSNVITPPKAGASEVLDENWAMSLEDKAAERLIAAAVGGEPGGAPSPADLPDDPFRRLPKEATFGSGAVLPGKLKKFFFEIDAQLIVYGKTDPTAAVTLQNEPVKLRPDGTFTMRYPLPDSRQIIPAVATSTDGMEEQTIVLAVERNTKRLDPMIHDLYGDT
jgi:hypothetical protein